MKLKIETKRLVLRELLFSDAEALLKMENNPNVYAHLGNNSIKTIDDANDFISETRTQYVVNKIGRFAILNKETNDLSFRLQEDHWGNGYAKEAAEAWLSYGFNKMKKHTIYAFAQLENRNSKRILEKIGMTQKSEYKWNDIPYVWYEVTKEEFSK